MSGLDPDRFKRLEALFEEARNLDEAARAALVARVRTDDPELADQLERVLAKDQPEGAAVPAKGTTIPAGDPRST